MNENLRLLICEDHHLVRGALIDMLKKSFIIAGEASDGQELVDKYFVLRPDVILTDLEMPRLSGLQAAAAILEKDPGARILLLTMHYTEQFIAASYNLGLKGILGKEVFKEEFLNAINTVAEGNIYFGPEYPESRIRELVKKPVLPLYPDTSIEVITQREKEVLTYMTEGLTSAEIAGQMNLSKKAVDAHRQKIMQKFNLKSSAALMKFAFDYVRSEGLLLL